MPSSSPIKQAATIIHNGGVISYPTESVFGLGCDPLCEPAVERILQLKKRSVDKGLIIIASNLLQLEPYIEISPKERQVILNEKSVMTWLVRKSKLTPPWVSGKHSKIAIRISRHPLIIALCDEINQPIISTSANPAGAQPAISCQQSKDYFTNQIDLYLDDSIEISGQPTHIKDIESGTIIR